MNKRRYVIPILTLLCVAAMVINGCKEDETTNPITPPVVTETSDWSATTFPAYKVTELFTASTGAIFAGTDSNGIYRSTDAGATWQSVNTGITNLHINSIAEGPAGTLFAGTYGPAIYKSVDLGNSWTEVDPFASGNADVNAIVVNKSGHIFAGMNLMGWVLRSTNGGTSWTALTVSSNVFVVYSLAIDTSGKLFAGTASGVYVSTNNGTSWSKPTTSFATADIFALCAAPDGCVWAGTYDQGMFCSTDHGVTWNATGLTTERVNVVKQCGTTLYIGTSTLGVYTSANAGTTVTAKNENLTNKNVFSLTTKDGTKLFAGTGSGIFKCSIE